MVLPICSHKLCHSFQNTLQKKNAYELVLKSTNAEHKVRMRGAFRIKGGWEITELNIPKRVRRGKHQSARQEGKKNVPYKAAEMSSTILHLINERSSKVDRYGSWH